MAAQPNQRALWISEMLIIITTEDDFEFVAKDSMKLTAEERHLINGKLHHPKATF